MERRVHQGVDRECDVIKYIWRSNDKGGDEDLEKANWYLRHFAYQRK